MNDVERVKGFGKTLKAFQNIADQVNKIVDLNAAQEEAERGADAAQKELANLTDILNRCKIEVSFQNGELESIRLTAKVIVEDANKTADNNLERARQEALDMVQNAHNAADQIRHTNKTEMTNLQKKKIQLETDLENVQNQVDEVNKVLIDLKSKFE